MDFSIPHAVHTHSDGILGPYPGIWWGPDSVDGTADPFLTNPIGTLYGKYQSSRMTWHQKAKNDGTNDDWVTLGGLHCITETVTRAQFTDGGSTVGTYVMTETIPAGSVVIRSMLLNITGFTGDTSATLKIGDGTTADRYSTGTPSVFTTAAPGVDMGVPSGTAWHTAAATITLTVTSAADFTNVTAGKLTVRIWVLR